MNNTRQYADFRACSNIKPALFRTEMRELQQVTTTVPDAAKKCRFYRVELLNGGKYWTRGEVPLDRRKRDEDGRSGKGGKVEEQEQSRWKIFIKQGGQNSEAIDKNFPKYPEMPKNVNAVFVGDFRRFAAGDVSYLRRISYVL